MLQKYKSVNWSYDSTGYAQFLKLQSCHFEVMIKKFNSFLLRFDILTCYLIFITPNCDLFSVYVTEWPCQHEACRVYLRVIGFNRGCVGNSRYVSQRSCLFVSWREKTPDLGGRAQEFVNSGRNLQSSQLQIWYLSRQLNS